MHEDLENSVAAGKVERAVAEKIDTLAPGTICNHRSWGVGRVVEWDLIGGRIVIDFEDKPGHTMALKFAANSLQAIEGGHFLSMRYAQKDDLVAQAESDPVDLVALAVEVPPIGGASIPVNLVASGNEPRRFKTQRKTAATSEQIHHANGI